MATATGPSPCAGAAAAFARAGWSVVPVHAARDGRCTCGRPDCPSPGKHPCVRWQDAMRRPAPPEQVARWWRRWPDAGVAVVTGSVSGVVVLDVDPRADGDEALAALEGLMGPLPATVESRTGGGGRHLLLAAPAQAVPSAVLAPGLELKAEGGTAVLPPSRHASGRRYAWTPGRGPDDLAPAPAPGWLVRLAREAGGRGSPGAPGPGPARTPAERREFAEAWSRAGVDLVPGDRSYRCPFHDDHHPSLHVDADGCRWYCFACRVGGGIGALRRRLGEPPTARRAGRARGFVGTRRLVTLDGDHPVPVEGESGHQDALLALAGGRRPFGGVDLDATAELVLRSRRAVDVEIGGRLVGRLAPRDAEACWRAIAATRDRCGHATCRARIRGGWDRGRGDVGRLGVTVLLP